MKNCENTLKKECVVLSFLLQTIIIISSSSSYCSSSCTITITCLCFLLPSDFLFPHNLSQHVLSNLKYHNKYILEPMTLSKRVCTTCTWSKPSTGSVCSVLKTSTKCNSYA